MTETRVSYLVLSVCAGGLAGVVYGYVVIGQWWMALVASVMFLPVGDSMAELYRELR